MENKIGLSVEAAETLTVSLNNLLADFQIYYQNLRGLHWNVKGRQFFHLHSKFEEFYNDASETVDEIAERILMLGQTPYHTFEDYSKFASIGIISNLSDGEESVKVVRENMVSLLSHARNIFSEAGNFDDEGTASMMSDLVSYFEKNIWMLSAYLND